VTDIEAKLRALIARENECGNTGTEAVQVTPEDGITLDDVKLLLAICDSRRFEAAKAAMQGLLAAETPDFSVGNRLAEAAVRRADNLLAQLARVPS
jgi:hypothetical protein